MGEVSSGRERSKGADEKGTLALRKDRPRDKGRSRVYCLVERMLMIEVLP